MKEYKFYKDEENKWYIDLPDFIEQGGFVEELEMVAGADIMLDILSNFSDKITLQISLEPFEDAAQLIKSVEQSCISGANYDVILKQFKSPLPIWLCDVTKYVFGDFPTIIYFKTKQ